MSGQSAITPSGGVVSDPSQSNSTWTAHASVTASASRGFRLPRKHDEAGDNRGAEAVRLLVVPAPQEIDVGSHGCGDRQRPKVPDGA